MPTRTLAPVLHYLRRIEAESHERRDTDGALLARFVRDGDEGAFATLLKRHGPMVYGVCRRVLRDRHEAEDAFQATFLLLVRKAASLRQPEQLGSWLHGVAYRTALKARSRAARHAPELLVGDVPAPPSDDILWRDLRPVLDRAIDELPAKYRVPFVLCHLQGLTNLQAARQLGCPEGTVATRLSRARERLRSRLARHALGSATLTTALGSATLSAAPPALLVVSTLRIATAFRLGASAAVPAAVAALTEGVGQAMLTKKLGVMLAALMLIGTLAGGTTFWAASAQDVPPPQPPPAPPAPAPQPPLTRVIPAPAPVDTAADPVLRTDNFQVHAPNRRIAQLVADAAERLRKSEAERWLGKELPRWSAPCMIQVKLNVTGLGCATSFQFDNGQVRRREMTLEGSLDRVLANGLPHEITHTILADHFRGPIPRWADEGAALQAEDQDEQQRHQMLMRDYADPSRLIPLKTLLRMKDYGAHVTAIYVEGYSLTHFLLERKDRATFLAFVKQGMAGNDWDAAVKAHYDFGDVDALQKAWLATVGPATPAQLAGRKVLTLKSPPPTIGRASITAAGRLILRSPVSYYQPVTQWRIAPAGEAAEPVMSYELKVAENVSDWDPANVTATDTAGKPIDARTLAKRLQTETAVLIAPAGQAIDPYYLAVVREGTIILSPRRAVVPPAPPVAPPAAPAPVPPQPASP